MDHILSFSASDPAATARVTELEPVDANGIIGRTPSLTEVLERVRRVAPTDMPVLITGETGTGKELLARAIHGRSRRASKRLVSVNLAALPETLAAADLFGHERGAFTGADRLRVGRFEDAHHGTLFLDEVGELPLDLQVMLLRVLQDGQFERLGGGATRHVDVRLVAATNRDLNRAIQEGQFREDLFYRLNVFPIHLPPLRERPEDIPALARYFLALAADRLGRPFDSIEPASLHRLEEYRWPGNIRQLRNVIEHSAILCDSRQLQVPPSALTTSTTSRIAAGAPMLAPDASAGSATLAEIQKRYISELLAKTRGNMLRTAAILDVDRRTLYRLVARYQIRLRTTGVRNPSTA